MHNLIKRISKIKVKRLLINASIIICVLFFYISPLSAYYGTNISTDPSNLEPLTGTMWDVSYGNKNVLYIFDTTTQIVGIARIAWKNSIGQTGYAYYGSDIFCCSRFIIEINEPTLELHTVLSFSVDGKSISGNYLVESYSSPGLWGSSELYGIYHENIKPNADAGPDITADSGDFIVLNQNDSSDPDDGIVLYKWEQISGPSVISGSGDQIYSFWAPLTNDEDIILKFLLTATDKAGLTDTDSTTVIVKASVAPDNTPPVISLIGDSELTLVLGQLFNDPGATAYDNKDGDLTSQIVVTGIVDENTSGTYQLSYDVIDDAGNKCETIIRTVIVIEKNTFDESGSSSGGCFITSLI